MRNHGVIDRNLCLRSLVVRFFFGSNLSEKVAKIPGFSSGIDLIFELLRWIME